MFEAHTRTGGTSIVPWLSCILYITYRTTLQAAHVHKMWKYMTFERLLDGIVHIMGGSAVHVKLHSSSQPAVGAYKPSSHWEAELN